MEATIRWTGEVVSGHRLFCACHAKLNKIDGKPSMHTVLMKCGPSKFGGASLKRQCPLCEFGLHGPVCPSHTEPHEGQLFAAGSIINFVSAAAHQAKLMSQHRAFLAKGWGWSQKHCPSCRTSPNKTLKEQKLITWTLCAYPSWLKVGYKNGRLFNPFSG